MLAIALALVWAAPAHAQVRFDARKVAAERGYRRPAIVCAITLEPIAGYRPASPAVKYLTGGREIELWLAPIAGTRLLAPFRLAVAGMLGNLVVEARQFEASPPARAALDAAH